MNNTSLTALGGVISALSVFIMFLSGIFPFLTYVIPLFAGLLLIVTVQEVDLKWSFFIYSAVAVLSLLIVADKESAVMYACFFGYYPIAKKILDSKFSKVISWILKFILFNFSIVAGYLGVIYVFSIPFEEMEEFGKYTALVFLGLGNIIFVMYDFMITNLSIIYNRKIHSRVVKLFNFK